MEPTLKLSQEIATQLDNFLTSEKGTSFFNETKGAKNEDVGTFEVIITTEDVDRVGEMIKADAWELDRYMLNPIVLWAHNYSELPVGIALSLEKVDGGKLLAKGKFAGHSKAQEVRALYDAGIMRATSVGFIPKEMEGNIITKAELLEFSFVPVPCNPYALSTLQKSGMVVDEFVAKGFLVKEVEEKVKAEGDVCTLEDGEEGMLVMENEELVCKPKAQEEEKAVDPLVKDVVFTENTVKFVFDNGEEKEYPVVADFNNDVKEGRVLSKKNQSLVEDAINSLAGTKSVLEALLEASRSGDAPVNEPEDTKSEVSEDDAFLSIRSTLQEVAGIVTSALADAKKEAKSRGIKVRQEN